MANTIPSDVVTAMSIKTASVLRENAGVLTPIQKDMQNVGAGVGESVVVGMTQPLSTGSVTPAAYISAFPTDMVLQSTTVSIGSWKKAEFYMTSRELAKITQNDWVPNQLSEAIRAVIGDMRAAVFDALRKTSGYVKTSQTALLQSTDGVGNIVDARKVLNNQFCPEGNRVLVISAAEEANALKLGQWLTASTAGDANAFRGGSIGRVLGMSVYTENSTELPEAITAGTGSGYKLDGAHALGTTHLKIDTGSGTILVGDSITIGNFSYTVKTALNAGYADIYAPGLVEAALNNADVTVNGDRDIGAYAFDPSAVMLVGRAPVADGSLGSHQVITDPVSGLMVKLSVLPADEAVIWRVSALFGADVVDPRKGCQLCHA